MQSDEEGSPPAPSSSPPSRKPRSSQKKKRGSTSFTSTEARLRNGLVALNIGGILYQTTRHTLCPPDVPLIPLTSLCPLLLLIPAFFNLIKCSRRHIPFRSSLSLLMLSLVSLPSPFLIAVSSKLLFKPPGWLLSPHLRPRRPHLHRSTRGVLQAGVGVSTDRRRDCSAWNEPQSSCEGGCLLLH